MADITRIRELAKALNLWNIARGRIELEDERLSNLDYLQTLLEAELDLRSRQRTAKLRKWSRLPQKAFSDATLNQGLKWQIRQLSRLAWIDEAQNLILTGRCGTGKTSLAVHLAEVAIEGGYKTYYTSFDQLLSVAEHKESKPRAAAAYAYIKECDLIIIDDVFYVPPDRAELQAFYRLIAFLNETRSLVLITNRELSAWLEAVEDRHLCQTLLDRITVNCQVIRLTGDGTDLAP